MMGHRTALDLFFTRFLLEQDHGLDHSSELRKCVAHLLQTSDLYNAAILGQSVEDYSDWIQRSNSWGGAIELALFSSYYRVQIVSIDIQTLRFDIFGQGDDTNYVERVYLLYSGIHYDAVYSDEPCDEQGHRRKRVKTRFLATDDIAASAALRLATILQDAHQFTDTAGFSLICNICKEPVRGQTEASSHAQATGHVDFQEYHE